MRSVKHWCVRTVVSSVIVLVGFSANAQPDDEIQYYEVASPLSMSIDVPARKGVVKYKPCKKCKPMILYITETTEIVKEGDFVDIKLLKKESPSAAALAVETKTNRIVNIEWWTSLD